MRAVVGFDLNVCKNKEDGVVDSNLRNLVPLLVKIVRGWVRSWGVETSFWGSWQVWPVLLVQVPTVCLWAHLLRATPEHALCLPWRVSRLQRLSLRGFPMEKGACLASFLGSWNVLGFTPLPRPQRQPSTTEGCQLSLMGTVLRVLLQSFSEVPNGIESQLFTEVIHSWKHTFLAFLSSGLTLLIPLLLPWIPFQINHLHPSSCLRIGFKGDLNWTS